MKIERIVTRCSEQPNKIGAADIGKGYRLNDGYTTHPDHYYVRHDGIIEPGLSLALEGTMVICICGHSDKLTHGHREALTDLKEFLKRVYPDAIMEDE